VGFAPEISSWLFQAGIPKRRWITLGGGIETMTRSEKSASLVTMTKSFRLACSQISVSVGLGLKLVTGIIGKDGENSMLMGKFSSKRYPFMQFLAPHID
jgi:hypothetical protein